MEKEFIVGQWYKILTIDNYCLKFKVFYCDAKSVYFEDLRYINHSNNYTNGISIEFTFIKEWYLLHISEIAQFLPKKHPDLQLINQTKSLFKI